MKGAILFCAVIGLIVVMVFPFARDAYNRHRVMSRLEPVLSQQDRTEFRAWQGDATSFARTLYARCELNRGAGASACEPYRLALQ